MSSVDATVVIDIGNSETRVKTYFGKDSSGNYRNRLSILPNRYSAILDGIKYNRVMQNSEYSEKNSRVFKKGSDFYCTGTMCDIEFQSSTFRPTAKEKKYESLSTEVTLRNVFIQGFEDVSAMSKIPVEDLEVNWSMVMLLPPQDLDVGAKKLAEMAKSIKSIESVMPKMEKKINIKKINVLPEGFCALMGVIFKAYGVPRQEYSFLLKDGVYTLIADIGAGTTDLNIAVGGKVMSNSRSSETIGGNNVQQNLTQKLRLRGVKVRPAKIQKACETGILEIGSDTVPVVDELNSSKREIATQIVNYIKEYLELGVAEIQDISYLLVCGGGAENSTNPEVVPISKYMIDFLNTQSSHLKLVELPEVLVNGKRQKISPRLLNIIGAGIIAEGAM